MTDREKVAVFWDFENCCPPSTQGLGYDIANNIGRIARIFGCVTTFRAYLDISSQPSKSTALRSELQLSGVSVVDCPHNGKKDVVDKMAIVDMFAFAVDNPPPATVILVSGDRDYAYALSTLRLRNYKVVLVTPRATSCLEACASFVIDWNVVLTKTRMESNADSVRRPYIDMEASLFDRLSREVSQFGDNLTGISVLPRDIKPRRSKSPDVIRPSAGDDTSIADELKVAQRSSEGMDQYTNGNDDSSGFVTASEVPASPRRSSITPPPPLRRRSASIRSELISKPGSESSRLVTELSDDADAISDPSVPDCGESHQSSKDEPLSSIPAGCSPVKAPPPQSTSYYSSGPHSVPLLNPELDMLPTNSTLSGTRTISGGTIVSLADTSQKMKWVDPPVPETGQVATPLFKSSSGSRESSLLRSHSNSCPPASASYDNNTSVPSLKATSPTAEGQSTPTNSAESVLRESSIGNDNLSSAPSPALRATFNVVPGSLVAHKPTPDANGMPANTTKEQADRKRIRRQFLPLIQLLVADRNRGIFHSSRSDVASALMQFDKNAYKHGGAATFKHYTALAERAGLVVRGGVERGGGGSAWIALHPDWFSEVEKPESQFKWTNTPRKISVGCFQPLVDVLVQLHRSGVRPVLRSRVRQMLGPTVHQVAEMGGFKKYVARADRAGFVVRGGEDDDAWICLHPDLENQVDDRYQASSSPSSEW